MRKLPYNMHGKELVSKIEIQGIILKLARQIYRDYRNANCFPILLCVQAGAKKFFDRIVSELERRGLVFESADISISSYEGTESTGEPKIQNYSGPDLAGRVVIVIEDIIDTAETMKSLAKWLESQNVLHYEICTLLFKKRPENFLWRLFGLPCFFGMPCVNYVGKYIENVFVIGFGMNFKDIGRDLPCVETLTPEAINWINTR